MCCDGALYLYLIVFHQHAAGHPAACCFSGAMGNARAHLKRVKRSFVWATRFGRLVKDYEHLPETLAGMHFLAFAIIVLKQYAAFVTKSPLTRSMPACDKRWPFTSFGNSGSYGL